MAKAIKSARPAKMPPQAMPMKPMMGGPMPPVKMVPQPGTARPAFPMPPGMANRPAGKALPPGIQMRQAGAANAKAFAPGQTRTAAPPPANQKPATNPALAKLPEQARAYGVRGITPPTKKGGKK